MWCTYSQLRHNAEINFFLKKKKKIRSQIKTTFKCLFFSLSGQENIALGKKKTLT